MSGVPSSLYSGRDPRLSVLKRQAISSLLKFDALIWSSGRYLVPAISAVYQAHSPSLGCHWLDRDWPNTMAARPATPSATAIRVNNLVFLLTLQETFCFEILRFRPVI